MTKEEETEGGMPARASSHGIFIPSQRNNDKWHGDGREENTRQALRLLLPLGRTHGLALIF